MHEESRNNFVEDNYNLSCQVDELKVKWVCLGLGLGVLSETTNYPFFVYILDHDPRQR